MNGLMTLNTNPVPFQSVCLLALKEKPHTRRGMLSLLSFVYDSLGFIAPITPPGKVLLQELCRISFGWDDNLSSDIQQHWTKWLEELVKLAEFKIRRCIKPQDFGPLVHACMHNFSDASKCGYDVL